jgi:hypothetical protein
MQLEDVCAPVVSKLYGAGGSSADSEEDLGDHNEL